MSTDTAVPAWLWRLVTGGLGVLVLGVAALAAGLLNGWADPPRAGPLAWADYFQNDTGRWTWSASPGVTLAPRAGVLLAEFTAADQTAFALAQPPAGDFTLEIAGAQTQGEPGAAAYGLVFDWTDARHYRAVLINNNGYVEAGERGQPAWFPWQQWPHILAGADANRVRVDRRGARLTFRVNDELLGEYSAAAEAGRLGVLARSAGAGRVTFSWVRVWAAP